MSVSTSLRREGRLPRVVIVGRPNVGKSTLFNRLVGSRRAITDSTPGVTRDTVEALCRINGREALLIDTAGVHVDGDAMALLVSQRSLDEMERASVVVLLVDISGLTAEDEEFIGKARKYSDKILLVANKADNAAREEQVWELHSTGFARVIAVSAEHDRNLNELRTGIADMLPAEQTDPVIGEQEPDIVRLAIIGKPNTGKSTLLNRLLGFDRAIVSEVPGTTRDVIEGRFEYQGRLFSVLDTAGIRRKKAVTDSVEYYSVSRAISSVVKADVVLLVVDAGEGISEQDKKIAAQIVKHGRGVILVFNKWDMLEDVGNTYNAVCDRTRYLFPILDFAPIVPVSAIEGTGIDALLSTVMKVRKQLTTRISTPVLNQALQDYIRHHPPPYGRKRFRVKYIAQTSADPVRFALFVNRVRGFPGNWISYLENKLRVDFNLSAIPIHVELRGR
jgi:GTP-binding protein